MSPLEKVEEYDLVIIGAGIYGLVMAKTYLEVHPKARLVVLDPTKSVGGTWAHERMYDELRTNNVVGSFEFHDFPMDLETYGVPPGSHVPGGVVHRYLTAYAQHFGVFNCVRFGAWVKSAELQGNGEWLILYELKKEEELVRSMKVIAKKMVLATGSTSEPNMPSIAGSETFGGHIFHFKELPKRKEEMNDAKNVVVLGGSKAAADTVYLNASKGKHVDWIVRTSGRGASWLCTPYVSPFKMLFEALMTRRIMSWLSPCIDSDAYPTIRKLLHNTYLGRAFLRGFFAVINADVVANGKYNDHPETKKLVPISNIYWSGTSVGVFNYPEDFFGLIPKGLINVHAADIASLSKEAVHLTNGVDIPSNILICATGWKQTPGITFLPESLSSKFGHSKADTSDPSVQTADAEIMRRFPELKDQPPAGPTGLKQREQTSYKLYRGTVPPYFLPTRNFAYAGMAVSSRTFLEAPIQALWIVAFLDNKLSAELPSEEEAEWQALLQSRFYRWRAPCGLGAKGPDMVFELMPFLDTLLRDLGLETRRKGGWREWVENYEAADYSGLVQEWLEKQK